MFNIDKHQLRLRRAASNYRDGTDFLMRLCVDDMIDRLSVINRHFDKAAVLFPRTSYGADQLKNYDRVGDVLRVEDNIFIGKADRQASPTLLDLEEKSLDLIIAPLCLHWSNDLPGTLIQIHRSLKADGLLLAALPGPDTLNELRQSLLQAESEVTGGAANRIDPFTDIRDAGALLQRAGFALPVVDVEKTTVRYGSALGLIHDLRGFGASLHLERADNPTLTRAVLDRLNSVYQNEFGDPDGRIRATFSFVSLSGWVPHESQQKPLKPGSAQSRLADALKSEEIKLKG